MPRCFLYAQVLLQTDISGVMASLVADYSSEDDVYSDSDSVIASNEPSEAVQEIDTNAKTGNLLFSEGQNDSEEEESEQSESEADEDSPPVERLPNPLLGDAQTSSVFVNPFKQAELAKQTVLEKHVQMTEKKNSGNKKMCYKFKKGKCVRGKNCRFSHDIDTLRGANQYADETSNDKGQYLLHGSQQPFVREPVDDDSFMANKKLKKRVGVTDNLVPPKKAMMSLNDQRSRERPWTFGNKKS